ncbi:hypothetical protein D3C74_245410 [compost metagenome]
MKKIIKHLFPNNRIIIYLALILMITILTIAGCDPKQPYNIQSTDAQSDSSKVSKDIVLKLEGDNQKQISYLFYNEADDVKTIVLSFYANYNNRKIEKVELLQGDTIVTNNVRISDTTINNYGKFLISLSNYIEKFNKIRLYDINGEIIFTLNTGQYYLEKVNIKNPSKGSEWYLSSYVTKEDINTFNMDAVFKKDGSELYKYQVIIPRKFDELNILKQKEEISKAEENSSKFHYESQISRDDFGNYVNIAYDMLVIQKDNQGRQLTLMSANIPLSITNKVETNK